MPFIKDILNYKSISFVGMDKNAGKTEALNYVISRLHSFSKKISVTSIGIDGETLDQVTATAKPKVFVYPETIFVTSEKLYDSKQIISSVCGLSHYSTSLGRLVTAEAKSYGNVMLSGPTNSVWLKETIDTLNKQSDICLIDGALSRKSFASPSITEAMILSTGAVVSANIDKITDKTKFMYDMTKLPTVEKTLSEKLSKITFGIHSIIDNEGNTEDLQIPSLLMLDKYKDVIFSKGRTLFVSGMITDKLIELIKTRGKAEEYTLITRDFTHIFSSPLNTRWFLSNGGKILCLHQTKLLAITANPVSPLGFKINNEAMLFSLREKINLPIYNIRDIKL